MHASPMTGGDSTIRFDSSRLRLGLSKQGIDHLVVFLGFFFFPFLFVFLIYIYLGVLGLPSPIYLAISLMYYQY